MGTEGAWLAAWSARAGSLDLTIRAKVTLARRKKQGWDVHYEGDLYTAVKRVDDADLIGFKPQGFDFRDGGVAYLCGQIPEASVFVQDPLRRTVEYLAQRKKLTPSQPFLLWLGDRQLGIVYTNFPQDETYGLVFIGHDVLDIASMQKTGLIDSIRYGADAQEIWGRRNRLAVALGETKVSDPETMGT